MSNKCLLPIYTEVYDENFSYSSFENRMKMQKAIYLLQNMGIPVGDYGFRWYIHGPYSQELLDDMYEEGNRVYSSTVVISQEYLPLIRKFKELVNSSKKGSYSTEYWVECLASLHYLKNNVLGFCASQTDIILELEKRKPHLNNREVNMAAYREVRALTK